MAKKKTTQQPRLTRKQVSRRRREQRQLTWLWIGVGAVGALVVAMLAAGLVAQNTRAMAVVNDQAIRVAEYQKRVRFWYNYYDNYLMPGAFEGMEAQQRVDFFYGIAGDLIEEVLIRQEAEKRGLIVTDQEVQIELEEAWFQHYRVPPTPTPSPTPDPNALPVQEVGPSLEQTPAPTPTPTPDTEEAFQANYQEFADQVLKPAGLNEAYFRQVVGASLLRKRMQVALVPDVPVEEEQVRFRYAFARDAEDAADQIARFQAGVEEQVHARHILVETQEEAEEVLRRLQGGEDFAALAAELSADESNKDQGGDLGWFGRGRMVEAFEEAAFGGPIGLYPSPVETQFGFHVIEVLERGERPIDMAEAMVDMGWYGREQLAEQFGPLFAAIVFDAEIGLIAEPVPTEAGVAVVEVLEHQVRTLNESEREQRRAELFQQELDKIREGVEIRDLWKIDMVPKGM